MSWLNRRSADGEAALALFRTLNFAGGFKVRPYVPSIQRPTPCSLETVR